MVALFNPSVIADKSGSLWMAAWGINGLTLAPREAHLSHQPVPTVQICRFVLHALRRPAPLQPLFPTHIAQRRLKQLILAFETCRHGFLKPPRIQKQSVCVCTQSAITKSFA
uniref:Uncharacterized protein n=1 Tax=Paramormyrops kingsleyae TaxID=1676925 RepID=A0A3B3RHZ9_9TELE